MRLAMGAALLLLACDGSIISAGLPPSAVTVPNGPNPTPATAPQLQSPVFRRLTKSELEASWAGVVQEPVTLSSSISDVSRESDNLDELSTNAAARQGYDDGSVDALHDEAMRVAHHAMAATLTKACTPAAADDACAARIIDQTARRAYRRPVNTDERAQLIALSQIAADEAQDPLAGVEFAVAEVLESPNGLYVAELGEKSATGRQLTAFELATRIAFGLSGGAPDDALLDAAQTGALETTGGITTQVQRLLAQSALPLGGFIGQLFSLDSVEGLQRDATLFPQATPSLMHGYRNELELAFKELYDTAQPYRAVFDQRSSFVNDEIAKEYGLPLPGSTDFVRSIIPDNWERRGLPGRGAFLALNALTKRSSPTQRGRFVLQRLLCVHIAPPPATVNTSLDGTSGATARERLAEHATNPACASCHKAMDGVGLSMEKFDALGGFRSQENGEDIDATGVLDGQTFDGERGLTPLLTADPRATSCAVQQLFRYASGNINADPAFVSALATQWEARGGTLSQLPEVVFTSPDLRALAEN